MDAVSVPRGQLERSHSTGCTLQIKSFVADDRSPYLFLKQLIHLMKIENGVYWNGEFVISAVYHLKGAMSIEAVTAVTAYAYYLVYILSTSGMYAGGFITTTNTLDQNTAVLSWSHVQALTAKDVTNSISNITAISADTLDLVKRLNTENVDTDGITALKHFRQIVTDANETTAIISASGNSSFAKDDQKDICETFTGFVKAQQDVLQALVSQKVFLSAVPLSMPIAAILRFLETAVDKLSFQVIGLVPTCGDESKKELKGLDKEFNKTLEAYPMKLHLPEVFGTSLEALFDAFPRDQ
ncbi:hypothetical protein V8C34DRAFT_321961 [Trichoderma compactum]